jgi:hypothetical protein
MSVHGHSSAQGGSVHGESHAKMNTSDELELTQKELIKQVIPAQIDGTWHYITIFVDGQSAGTRDSECEKIADDIQNTVRAIVGSTDLQPTVSIKSYTFDLQKGTSLYRTEKVTPRRWRSNLVERRTHRANMGTDAISLAFQALKETFRNATLYAQEKAPAPAPDAPSDTE